MSSVTALLEEIPSTRQLRGGVLLVIKGPDRGATAKLGDAPVAIGSSPACQLVLTDTTVSRKHVEVALVGDEIVVTDCGSRNGCTIQGVRVEKGAISFGTELKLGRTIVKLVPDEELVAAAPSPQTSFGSIVGGDTRMRQLFTLLGEVAATDATVLVEGETGTGKELIAEELHNHSPRKNGPLVVVDCGSVPRELVASILFGHMKGAFTGALSDRKGMFAEAHGGTIFLDEIGELPLELQPALLRALDKRAVCRVGATAYERFDARVVAATNRDLRAEVGKKRFREDLYYRLAVIRVAVPALRERGSDIRMLIEHFVRRFAPDLTLSPDDMARLVRHSWPGNVRELRNAMERICLLSRNNVVDVEGALGDISAGGSAPGFRTDLPFKEAKNQLVEAFEREYIEGLVERHQQNLSAAAREAQIDRKHLRELMRKYGLGGARLAGDDE
ncbi:MAG: sigma 54-dependent Fis family transcriptional regulator [Deltaproteobacteria bacterium]|nr:sigma 54-dependent Fis family transcriptional regulator [Deltaproteobacteria bacterium]MCW5804179.1 sigma 54-dependent Fis family transcriptional regulator [Deltaproteobacteria bacterium]